MAIPKVRFEKVTTYGNTWFGYVQDKQIFKIERKVVSNYGFLYTLSDVATGAELDGSCRLNDVMRTARGARDFIAAKVTA